MTARTVTLYDYADETTRLARVERKIRHELAEEGRLEIMDGRARGGTLAVESQDDIAKVLERMTAHGEITATVVELPDPFASVSPEVLTTRRADRLRRQHEAMARKANQ